MYMYTHTKYMYVHVHRYVRICRFMCMNVKICVVFFAQPCTSVSAFACVYTCARGRLSVYVYNKYAKMLFH